MLYNIIVKEIRYNLTERKIINNEDYNAVLRALPNMSETEKDIAMQCLYDGYSVSETVDHILYGSIGGYSLEEYIQDVTDLGI